MNVVTRSIGALALLSLGVALGSAWASPEMVAAAKKAGMPANNCQYCHTEALPKKETFKPEALNDRGKYLLADMQKRNLKSPDVGSLKDFPGGTGKK